jgi:Putative porin
MKIRSIALLFFVFGTTPFSAFAENNNALPLNAVAASDAATPATPGPESSAVKKEGVPAGDGSATNTMVSPPSKTPADASTSAATDVPTRSAPNNPPQPGTAPNDVPVKSGVVRVPYVPEVVMREIKEEIRQEVLAQAKGERWGDPGALPDWLSRISWDGDFRLRYQRDSFPPGNTLPGLYNPPGLTLISDTTDTHNYLRIQARLGMKAKVSDYTFAAFRISTGTTSNPVSTNQTLGTGFNKYSLVLDRAFVQSDPYYWLALSGGKMPNPWLYTDLVWDSDVNFEGVAAQLKQRISEEWSGILTAGAFPFQDIQRSDTVSAQSKWLYGAQLSARWTAMNSSTAQFGLALYDFQHVEGIPNAISGEHLYDNTAAQSMQKGNTLVNINASGDVPNIYGLASKFRELDLTGKMDWATFDPVHVMLAGDYVKNLGFDSTEIAQRTGLAAPLPKVVGYQTVLTVGNPRVKQRGDWQASVAYKYLESDAVLDALTDSDFHLGGTNAKGFIIGASYGLDKETSLGMRWISTDQIDGPPLSIDTLQVDLSVRF